MKQKKGGKTLTNLITKCEIDTGSSDLAAQHDHYLYNTPKRKITESEIDEFLIAQAGNDDAWERPVSVTTPTHHRTIESK